MKIVFEHPRLKNRRQDLRLRSTIAEKVLWERIRNRKLGFKFIRQYSVEGYVMDFYCPEKRVAIELEGGVHRLKDVKVYDKFRKRFIEAYNIKFLVFRNDEVLSETVRILKMIAISLS